MGEAKMKKGILISCAAALVLSVGCGNDDDGDDPGQTPQPVDCSSLSDPLSQQACNDYPRVLDMHVGLMMAVCSPNPNVCHQTNNYPDMHSVANLLSVVGEPCNVELPDPTQGWDSCELLPDRIQSLSHSTDLAWIDQLGAGYWGVGLRDPAPSTTTVLFQVYDNQGGIVLQSPQEWLVEIAFVAGTSQAEITIGIQDGFVIDYVDAILATLAPGDSNRNGTWGGTEASIEPGALIWAGDLDKSYLWGRITGKVPGTRMPLANGPVTNPQYIALACWIEGLDPDISQNLALDAIRYDQCQFAQAPEDLEISDF